MELKRQMIDNYLMHRRASEEILLIKEEMDSLMAYYQEKCEDLRQRLSLHNSDNAQGGILSRKDTGKHHMLLRHCIKVESLLENFRCSFAQFTNPGSSAQGPVSVHEDLEEYYFDD